MSSSELAAAPAAGRSLKRVDLASASGSRLSESVMPLLLASAAIFSGLIVTLVVFFVAYNAVPTFRAEGLSFITRGGWDTQINNAFTPSKTVFFGAEPLLIGTLLSTVGAVLVSLVLGTGCAIFLSELAPAAIRRPFESLVQLLAGIPSVVFGLVGLSIVVPFIQTYVVPANAANVVPEIPIEGASLLAAITVLSFMILPFFVTVAVDSLRAIPRSYVDGGLALGMTKWRTITRIQVPAAAPGLVAGLVLAAARATGEAIAVSMVAGAIAFSPNLNHGPLYMLLMPIRTIASSIVETGGDAMSIPSIASALFALATLLLLFSLILSLGARWAFAWFNKRMGVRQAGGVQT